MTHSIPSRVCWRSVALAALFSGSVGLTQAAGCSPSADTGAADGLLSGTGAAGSGAGGSGTGSSPGAGSSTGAGPSLALGDASMGAGGGGVSPFGADGGCQAISQGTEAITQQVEVPVYSYSPVAIYIMQDRSSSMVGVMGDPQRWPDASTAVTQFANDPNNKDLIVGLGFFPGYPGDGNTCDGSGCQKYVDFAPLSTNATNISNAYGQATPPTFPPLLTPTECALRGATVECAQYQNATQIPCVVLLVTDGAPTQCDTTTAGLSNIAATALSTWNVQTYTLGMQGADFTVLNSIATAGGTDCDPNGPNSACDISTGGSTAFVDALNTIRAKVQVGTQIGTKTVTTQVDCQWKLPSQDAGAFDTSKVNAQYTVDPNTPQAVTTPLGKVPSGADCASYGDLGWYFDNETNPTQVQVCSQTCNTLKAATNVKVDIVLGCPTVMQPPPQ